MEFLVVLIIAVAAVAAVLYPLIRGDAAGVPLEAEDRSEAGSSDIEAEVTWYRAALRAGTLCRGCGCANPEGSLFCAECGRRLLAGRTSGKRRTSA